MEFVTEIKRANRRTTILTERLQNVATYSNQDIGDAEEEIPRKIGDAEEGIRPKQVMLRRKSQQISDAEEEIILGNR